VSEQAELFFFPSRGAALLKELLKHLGYAAVQDTPLAPK
jgi:hypothetical protein